MSKNGPISQCLEKLRLTGKKGLITFTVAGDPNPAGTVDIVRHMVAGGADLVELGIPFSDPLADGPVIQQSSLRALASGAALPNIFEAVKEIRKNCSIPLILMGYYNPIYQYGLRRFAGDAAQAGVNGIIVPDLPHEESVALRAAALESGLDLIPLVAPTTTDSRLEKIAAGAMGFIYCVSLTGVTGAGTGIKTDLAEFTGRVSRHTRLPLAVGFGIAAPEQAAMAAKHCDAVVVGSAIIKIIAGHENILSAGPVAERLIKRFRGALDRLT